MNIKDITIRQIEELRGILNTSNNTSNNTATETKGLIRHVGHKVIIRTYSAGNWFGLLSEKDGNEVILVNARRMHAWKAAKSIALSGVAVYGIVHEQSRICGPVDSVWLEAIEIIECSHVCKESISTAPEYEAR